MSTPESKRYAAGFSRDGDVECALAERFTQRLARGALDLDRFLIVGKPAPAALAAQGDTFRAKNVAAVAN